MYNIKYASSVTLGGYCPSDDGIFEDLLFYTDSNTRISKATYRKKMPRSLLHAYCKRRGRTNSKHRFFGTLVIFQSTVSAPIRLALVSVWVEREGH